MIASASRDHEPRVHHGARANLGHWWLLCELEADAGAIVHVLAGGRVVNLECQHGSSLDQHRAALLEDGRRRARRRLREERPPPDGGLPRRGILIGHVRRHGAARRISRTKRHRTRGHTRVTRVDQHVVHHGAVTRANLERLNPPILGEVRRNLEVLIGNFALRRHAVGALHAEHRVGLSDGPTLRVHRSRRQVLRVALRCARRDPPRDHILLGGRQAAVVLPRAVCRIGMPGRHRPVDDVVTDGASPGPCLLVAQERHRGNFPRPMARGAVLVEHRRDIL